MGEGGGVKEEVEEEMQEEKEEEEEVTETAHSIEKRRSLSIVQFHKSWLRSRFHRRTRAES